jgi:hypothetical protein
MRDGVPRQAHLESAAQQHFSGRPITLANNTMSRGEPLIHLMQYAEVFHDNTDCSRYPAEIVAIGEWPSTLARKQIQGRSFATSGTAL